MGFKEKGKLVADAAEAVRDIPDSALLALGGNYNICRHNNQTGGDSV